MRLLMTGISLLLLIACGLAVAGWVRSHRIMDEWSMANAEGQVIGVVSYQGAIHYTRAGRSSAPRGWSYDSHRIPEGATWGELYTTPGTILWRRLGFVRIRSAGPMPLSRSALPFGGGGRGAVRQGVLVFAQQSLTPWLLNPPYDAWAVPYWALAAATGVVPLLWLPLLARRVRRRWKGWCSECGYDLRASSERCPECGRAIKGAKAGGGDADRVARGVQA